MANKAPNFKILSGSIMREENGKPKTYERGESIFMTEKQAQAYGFDLLERLGEKDVVTRSGALEDQARDLAEKEAKLRAMNEDLSGREKALADAQKDLAEAQAKLKEDQQILIEARADLGEVSKALTAREDALADAEAKAKAEAEAKASKAK